MKTKWRVLQVAILIIIIALPGCTDRTNGHGDLNEAKDYLKTTPYTDFSYAELLKKAQVRAKDMMIEDLNMSVGKNGEINSIVLDYGMVGSKSAFTFMFKKDSDYIKIRETPNEGGFRVIDSGKASLLDLVDLNLKNPWDWHVGEEAYVIDLEAPSVVITPTQAGNVYVNGDRVGQFPKEVEGISFFVHGITMSEENNSRIYVFTH